MFHTNKGYHARSVAAPPPRAFFADPLSYPDLLTGSGVQAAYDPAAFRPVSPTYSSQLAPELQRALPVDPLSYPDLLTGSGVQAAYDPAAFRPVSPTYSSQLPPDTPHASALSQDARESVDAGLSVEGIRFFARSPEEILKLSCVEVTTDKISEGGIAVDGGLRDPRFGCSAGRPCGTCHARANRPCDGHFGSYVLAEPLFNIMYIKFVALWLRLLCSQCGTLQPPPSAFQGVTPPKLNDLLVRLPKKCKSCGSRARASLAWDREQQLLVETSTGDTIRAREALAVFRKLPDDFVAGVEHPRRFITSVVFVPSTCIRPAVGGNKKGETPRGESDLTYRLVKIIRADKLVRKKRSDRSDPVSCHSAVLGLQNAYTGYLDASKTYRRSKKVNTSSTGVEARATKYNSLCDPLKVSVLHLSLSLPFLFSHLRSSLFTHA
jgi:hypothetical protein